MAKANRKLRAVSAVKPIITSMIAKQYRATTYDPTMLQINLLLKHSRLSLSAVANRCGVSQQCMRNWQNQRTHRPQALTMKFVLRALGYDLRVVPAASALRTDDDE